MTNLTRDAAILRAKCTGYDAGKGEFDPRSSREVDELIKVHGPVIAFVYNSWFDRGRKGLEF